MAEMINMTNLNDLPSNPTMGGNIQNQMQSNADKLNKSSIMSLDETTISQIVNGLQQASLSGATRLQTRDIPMTSEHLTSDKQAMPNYVPTNSNNKYIDDDDDDHNFNSKPYKNLNNLYSELQFPLLLGILYFIFQMPVFKNSLFQYFTFLFSSDGNYNMNGMAFLSIMFSLTYYVFTNIIFKER
jgi:hypothetical protein